MNFVRQEGKEDAWLREMGNGSSIVGVGNIYNSMLKLMKYNGLKGSNDKQYNQQDVIDLIDLFSGKSLDEVKKLVPEEDFEFIENIFSNMFLVAATMEYHGIEEMQVEPVSNVQSLLHQVKTHYSAIDNPVLPTDLNTHISSYKDTIKLPLPQDTVMVGRMPQPSIKTTLEEQVAFWSVAGKLAYDYVVEPTQSKINEYIRTHGEKASATEIIECDRRMGDLRNIKSSISENLKSLDSQAIANRLLLAENDYRNKKELNKNPSLIRELQLQLETAPYEDIKDLTEKISYLKQLQKINIRKIESTYKKASYDMDLLEVQKNIEEEVDKLLSKKIPGSNKTFIDGLNKEVQGLIDVAGSVLSLLRKNDWESNRSLSNWQEDHHLLMEVQNRYSGHQDIYMNMRSGLAPIMYNANASSKIPKLLKSGNTQR